MKSLTIPAAVLWFMSITYMLLIYKKNHSFLFDLLLGAALGINVVVVLAFAYYMSRK